MLKMLSIIISIGIACREVGDSAHLRAYMRACMRDCTLGRAQTRKYAAFVRLLA